MTAVVIVFLIAGTLFYYWWLSHTWNAGAPYEGMPPDVVTRMLKIADVGPKDVFYELGSGDGRVVIAAAMKGAKCVGIEIDKLRTLYSKVWIKLLRLNDKIEIINKDLYEVNFSKATVVSMFLIPETHNKLKDKLKKELKKGTKVVAVGFEIKDWKAIKTDIRGPVYGPIFLYKI